MITVTMKGVRRPDGQRKGRNGAEVVLLGPVQQTIGGNSSWINKAPPPMPPYKFGFWSVNGAANGSFVSLGQELVVLTGTTDVVAKAWYVLADPKPPTGSQLLVDAFDIEHGSFLDSDFVAIKDQNNVPDPKLGQGANNNGVVPTNAKRLVEANANVPVERKFDRWECVTGKEAIVGQLLTAAQGSSAEAIAFYAPDLRSGGGGDQPGGGGDLPGGGGDQPSPVRLADIGRALFAGQTWVSWGVTVDGGGPTGKGPVPPWTPLTLDLAAGLALAEAAGRLHPTLRAEALRIAAKQILMAAQEIAKAVEAQAER